MQGRRAFSGFCSTVEFIWKHPLLHAVWLVVLLIGSANQLFSDGRALYTGASELKPFLSRFLTFDLSNPILALAVFTTGLKGIFEIFCKFRGGQKLIRLCALAAVILPQVLYWNALDLLAAENAPSGAYRFITAVWFGWTFIIGPFALLLAFVVDGEDDGAPPPKRLPRPNTISTSGHFSSRCLSDPTRHALY